jgi:glutamyl-Q tRNA(Asp) synthetase
LLTALASYLDARSQGGRWLLRIDDLDAPRCRPQHIDTILHQLEAHGLGWDEAPRLQSAHRDEYEAAFETLEQQGRLYRCRCSRAQLAASSLAGPDGPVYAGTCRDLSFDAATLCAWRLRLEGDGSLELADDWNGPAVRDRRRDIGDYTLRRADGQIGYQLACVVDERALQITDVVRGADLIGSSFRQIELCRALELSPPRYRHVPVLIDHDGRKLSKQNHAAAVDSAEALSNLRCCLQLLGQSVPDTSDIRSILEQAITDWNPGALPSTNALPMPLDGRHRLHLAS